MSESMDYFGPWECIECSMVNDGWRETCGHCSWTNEDLPTYEEYMIVSNPDMIESFRNLKEYCDYRPLLSNRKRSLLWALRNAIVLENRLPEYKDLPSVRRARSANEYERKAPGYVRHNEMPGGRRR